MLKIPWLSPFNVEGAESKEKMSTNHIPLLKDSKVDQNAIFGFLARIFDDQPLFLQLDNNPTVILGL